MVWPDGGQHCDGTDEDQARIKSRHVRGALLLHLKRTFTLKNALREALRYSGPLKLQVHLIDHHLSRAASAFFPSSFDEAAIFSVDAWAVTVRAPFWVLAADCASRSCGG
jgi:predicted NodU family carbamoyl transferase